MTCGCCSPASRRCCGPRATAIRPRGDTTRSWSRTPCAPESTLGESAVVSTASHARLFASLLGEAGTATPAEVAGRAGVTPEAAAETLSALAREGLLEEMPGGGYRAGRLDSREVRELYPAVLMLESVAVRDAPRYDAATISRMREANATLEAAGNAEEGARGDDRFHQRLTEGCGNQRLLDVVRPLRQALMAYE